jgi:hypothetical protein
MNLDRWVVLGLARPRSSWFSELAKWSTAATVPVDFIKCMSSDEVCARLTSGRAHSALLVGSDVRGLDRDLIDSTTSVGAAVIVVDPNSGRNWADLGISGALPATFDRAELMTVLAEHAPPIRQVRTTTGTHTADTTTGTRGHLVAVTGSGGSGTSTVAMALAQALGNQPDSQSMVLLADLARNGEQAMLHDARNVVPGVQELVDAHRVGRLPSEEIRALTFDAVGRGYHLLLGLRRTRDWTAIQTRAFEAALDGLQRAYGCVIADVDAEVEGESETGSIDVEDRNLFARTTFARADIVLVTGLAGVKGLHSLTRTLRDLSSFGIPVGRLLPVIGRAPRSPRRRIEIRAVLGELMSADELSDLRSPVYVPDRKDLEIALRDGVQLPHALGAALLRPVEAFLSDSPQRPESESAEPVAVQAGVLGSWSDEDPD